MEDARFNCGPSQVWNTVPEDVKNADSVATFKTKLKHFYSVNISTDFVPNTFCFSILKFTILDL